MQALKDKITIEVLIQALKSKGYSVFETGEYNLFAQGSGKPVVPPLCGSHYVESKAYRLLHKRAWLWSWCTFERHYSRAGAAQPGRQVHADHDAAGVVPAEPSSCGRLDISRGVF